MDEKIPQEKTETPATNQQTEAQPPASASDGKATEEKQPAATPKETTATGTQTAQKQAQPVEQPGLLGMLPMFLLMFAVLYFLVIRPQSKQKKEREKLLGALEKNDHVLTSGGIYGIIQTVKDEEVTLKVDEQENVKLRVNKQAIIQVVKKANEPKE